MKKSKDSKPREDYHLISPTAKMVAFMRAATDIPYSKEISEECHGAEASEMVMGTKELINWMAALVELRYKSLSELLHQEMNGKDIFQILELASGVQPRGLLESENPNVQYIETDLPGMIEEKRRLVEKIDPEALDRENYEIRPLNAFDSKGFNEIELLLTEKKVAVINEGLLQYLSPLEKEKVATNIYQLLKKHGGVWITPDISNSERMRKIIELFPDMKDILTRLNKSVGRNMRENNIGNKEETLNFYRKIGFKITEYLQTDLVDRINSFERMIDEKDKKIAQMVMEESPIWILEPFD